MNDDAPPVDATLFKGEYQDWCRLQMQFAHHDIWWVKGAQLKAGNFTLLLLAAVVAASRLLWKERADVPSAALVILSVLGGLTVILGGLYAWDLFNAMVNARARAKQIADLVNDPKNVFKGTKKEPKRNVAFPITITLVAHVAWAVTLHYFDAVEALFILLPALSWVGLLVWGLNPPEDD